jgi:hypothetical protein
LLLGRQISIFALGRGVPYRLRGRRVYEELVGDVERLVRDAREGNTLPSGPDLLSVERDRRIICLILLGELSDA